MLWSGVDGLLIRETGNGRHGETKRRTSAYITISLENEATLPSGRFEISPHLLTSLENHSVDVM